MSNLGREIGVGENQIGQMETGGSISRWQEMLSDHFASKFPSQACWCFE